MNEPVTTPSRPISPSSPMTSSFYDATSTIDDLTTAIADLSRIPSPDPVAALTCCCGTENCENYKSWIGLKTKLNQRLVLSAEIGQALLHRHESYVRQSERRLRDSSNQISENDELSRLRNSNESLQKDLDDFTQERKLLEKRLNQALVNSEVTEVSSNTILQELQDARETISRLTAHHARSVGWETRLSSALKERDDMQQERDGETHRARLAESRFAFLKEKTAKLQTEVRRLHENLEEKRLHRLESSEYLIQDAKTRLESFRNSQLGLTTKAAEDELSKALESMVTDNEILKRDNAELQHLLTEAREEIHCLQEEVEERRANPTTPRISGVNTPITRHQHSGSVPTANLKDFILLSPPGRHNGVEHRSRRSSQFSRLTSSTVSERPEATRSPMSIDTLAPTETKSGIFGQTSPAASHLSFEVEEDAENDGSPTLFEKYRGHRPLLLLTRSRGVQTESFSSGSHSPAPLPSHLSSVSPHELPSESSSFSESQSSHVTAILERVVALFSRLTQTDAFTLTNRLKRQHLKGADVGHLSRSTVSNILAEAIGLRTQFRFLLEDEKIVTTCTRKDMRVLFKIIKDLFTELGQMRVTLNDVILDPSSAVRLSEFALNPSKAEGGKEREIGGHNSATGWMAPISKLFLPSGIAKSDSSGSGDRSASSSGRTGANMSRPIPKFAPKLGPALAASTTTVNVEFSGTGVGRAITSTVRLQPTVPASESATVVGDPTSKGGASSSSGLRGIFAGAQKSIEPSDPWVVIPSGPRKPPRVPLTMKNGSSTGDGISNATLGRSVLRRNTNRLSRNVDAVIDIVEKQQGNEERQNDDVPPLLQRTLRRRGVSDTSIHSTFTSHGGPVSPEAPSLPRRNVPSAVERRMPAWRDPNSVLQVFNWGVFNFKQPDVAAAVVSSDSRERETSEFESTSNNVRHEVPTNSVEATQIAIVPAVSADHTIHSETPSQLHSPIKQAAQSKPATSSNTKDGRMLPNLASWAASNIVVDDGFDFVGGSLRDETFMPRGSFHRRIVPKDDTHGRDFF